MNEAGEVEVTVVVITTMEIACIICPVATLSSVSCVNVSVAPPDPIYVPTMIDSIWSCGDGTKLVT